MEKGKGKESETVRDGGDTEQGARGGRGRKYDLLFVLSKLHFYLFNLCVCVCCNPQVEVRGQLWKWVLCFYLVGPREQAPGHRHGEPRELELLSGLSGPALVS